MTTDTLTLERYAGRPSDGHRSPPGSLGSWPTGFAGTGWLVRDSSGAIVYAHAFRAECLMFVTGQDFDSLNGGDDGD
jgi:hypothetical protein